MLGIGNQTVSWEKVTGSNIYNDLIYSEPETIYNCRYESSTKIVRDRYGEEVVSSAFLMTETPVNLDDKINGRLVLSVAPMPDLMGNIDHYEVYLK